MIGLEDRQRTAQWIDKAHRAGARLRLACQVAGIDVRTLQRWKAHEGLQTGDRRPDAVHPKLAHALTEQERAAVLQAANEPRFADMPPARIVPTLADEGVYLASESTFTRVLRDAGQNQRRGRAKAPHARRPPQTPNTDPCGDCAAPGAAPGRDVSACTGIGTLVLSVPDHGSLQPQDRGLGGAR
jgi:crotonobetainyl-CoA:carnitine CoA-transferase CaiB-like acyl-CoA transferase